MRTCIGCLQTGFKDVAQYNFPARPTCSSLTTPNVDRGNPCNLAQDYGPMLCCTGGMNDCSPRPEHVIAPCGTSAGRRQSSGARTGRVLR